MYFVFVFSQIPQSLDSYPSTSHRFNRSGGPRVRCDRRGGGGIGTGDSSLVLSDDILFSIIGVNSNVVSL